jgi:hypothetical protein
MNNMREEFERWWATKKFEGTTPILIQALKELAWEAFQAGVLSITNFLDC